MAAHPLRLPTEQECERFHIDGAVALKGVYQEDWVDLLRNGVERAMQTEGPYTRRIQDEGDPAFFTITWHRTVCRRYAGSSSRVRPRNCRPPS